MPPALLETTADTSAPIRQIAADAYEAIKAIASQAIDKIQQSGARFNIFQQSLTTSV